MNKYRLHFYIVNAILFATILSIGIFSSIAHASPSSQVTPITDPYAIRTVLDNRFQTELYENSSTLVIEYRESDLVLDQVTLLRPATSAEQSIYLLGRQQALSEAAIATAVANVSGPAENGIPDQWLTWSTNRQAELLQCESDMANGQLLDYNSLGSNAQNTFQRRNQECIELNNRVLRITINKFGNFLIAQGLITP